MTPNSRSYINRFLSADTIVPGYGNPQSLNRFSYVRNNPIRYTDPTGHREVEGCGDDGKGACHASDLEIAINAQKLAKLEKDKDRRLCKAGDETYCSPEVVMGGIITGEINVGWNANLVPWDDVAIDVLGLIGDAIPLAQLPATYVEGAKLFNWSVSGVEAYDNGWDIAQGDRDVTAIGLDGISLIPGIGAAGSALGIVHNLLKGFYTYWD